MQDLQKEILSRYDIVVRCYEDNRVEDIGELLKQINHITSQKDGSVIQLLDCDYVCGNRHLKQGIAQAIKSFDEKQNFAKDMGLEICVRLSAQKQISHALKILGIKNHGNITVIYMDSNDKQIEETEKLLSGRNDSLLEIYDENKIIEVYDLDSDEMIVENINEKIALLTLKN